MRIGLQLLIGYVLISILACYLVFNIFLNEVKPTVRRATEGTLIDTAALLATIVSHELSSINDVKESSLAKAFNHINETPIKANIDGVIKTKMVYRVYITDINGIVVFDSEKIDEGKDYSRWNDVYLTLRGKYGARTTKSDPNDSTSSIMYVAAPIKIGNQLIGVLTVSKPNQSMSLIIQKGERRILMGGAILISVALLIGLLIIWWINRSVKKLVNYAMLVSNHQNAVMPKLISTELITLGNALEQMRLKLDGKNYIEKYVHTLAHELKSPLSSIRAANEILQDNVNELDLSNEQLQKINLTQVKFLNNIDQQTERMSQLIERMLQLVRLESRVGVNFSKFDITTVLEQQTESKLGEALLKNITLKINHNEPANVMGDKFLITQAINNLICNALDFTPSSGEIDISGELDGEYYIITIKDNGTGIPDYALQRIYDRFYSLPRPHKAKSSGLGLSFVKEVAKLHNGKIDVYNREDIKGTIAKLTLKIN